ncbi:uncharacterized protein LOC123681015 [Harmonia axyridis]|uniref:uncharacterized protein LOC123681015 n=1 Tax=Harmonia axyridis TaxID=115357 RepID=UPI001E2756A2|nr:uncharacterized protein LOC123681015 [Harmonia axyridis]
MKFLVLFLAVAALASAKPDRNYIDIKQDGTIYIESEEGKQIWISKNYGLNGQKKIEIEVTGPNGLAKMYKFDYNNQVNFESGMGYTNLNTFNKNYQDQYDILDVIFREYLGYVDEYTYQQLLNKVHKAVLNGYFDGQVLYILQALVEDTKWDNLSSGRYSYGQFGDLLNKMTQQNKYGLRFLGKLFQGQDVYDQEYKQYNVNYYYNAVMRIFDRQVLKTVLLQQQMYNQEIYGQYSFEKMWNMIFTQQGIFDHQYLVEIINNQELRNWFVQRGFFDREVLDQILDAYKTQGVYDQFLLPKLVNTQELKYFFVKNGISVYDILGQNSYNQYYGNTYSNKGFYGLNKGFYGLNKGFYGLNKGFYGLNKGIYGYNMLEKIISEPMFRNVMIQYGIFNKNILDQILYQYNTQGVYDQVLLRQLVNKQALYNVLVQYGVVDQVVLRQFLENQNLGFSFLFKKNFFEQTPRMTYNHLLGAYGNAPEYGYRFGGNYLKNFLYGQQYYGYNQVPYSYGKLYNQYQLAQRV